LKPSQASQSRKAGERRRSLAASQSSGSSCAIPISASANIRGVELIRKRFALASISSTLWNQSKVR